MLTTITFFNNDNDTSRSFSVQSELWATVVPQDTGRRLAVHADPVEPTERGYKGGSTRITLTPAEAIRLAHNLLAEAHAMEHK